MFTWLLRSRVLYIVLLSLSLLTCYSLYVMHIWSEGVNRHFSSKQKPNVVAYNLIKGQIYQQKAHAHYFEDSKNRLFLTESMILQQAKRKFRKKYEVRALDTFSASSGHSETQGNLSAGGSRNTSENNRGHLVTIITNHSTIEAKHLILSSLLGRERSPVLNKIPIFLNWAYLLGIDRGSTTIVEFKKDTNGADVLVLRDPRNITNYGDNNCSKHPSKQTVKRIFKKWIQLAKRLNISYFLIYGSLLGSYRDTQYIPYDKDVDIMVNFLDYYKLKQFGAQGVIDPYDGKYHLVIQRELEKPLKSRRHINCKQEVIDRERDNCSFTVLLGRLVKWNLHVDIWYYIQKEEYVIDPWYETKPLRNEFYFPLRQCKLMGLETWCPNNPKVVLSLPYGDDLSPIIICLNKTWVSVKPYPIPPKEKKLTPEKNRRTHSTERGSRRGRRNL